MSTRYLLGPLGIALAFVIAILCMGSLCQAQLTTTATITGTVRDTSGAIVPQASVSIINQATGVQRTTLSNSDGSFAVPALLVGTYTVKVTKKGFDTFTESGIILHPALVATVNPRLQVGKVSTSVTVVATAAQVQTATPEISDEVSEKQVATLPLNGRNYQSLSALMPGVTNEAPDTALDQGGFLTSNEMSVNGMGTSGTQYFLDGIWDENTGNMTQTTVTPNPDTIQEVRVLQNNFSVQYSLNGANVVILETRSGTSSFHGRAFEYLRNNALDARNFFSPTTPPLHQNIFGYTIGGPVYIPHHYNTSKQKTFFFWSEQWTRENIGSTLLGADPTAAMRAGTFASSTPITNPLTGQPFPQSSPGVYQIPPSMLNPSSLALLNGQVPLPNYGTAFLNYINLNPDVIDQRDDEIRVDHNFSEKVRLMAEYLDERQTAHNPDETFGTNGPWATVTTPYITQNQLAQVHLTTTLSPSMVNSASIAMNNYVVSIEGNGIWQRSQVPGFNEVLPFPNAFGSNRLPQIGFSEGYSGLGFGLSAPLDHAGDLEDTVSDDWSWLRGRHYIQAGASVVLGTKRQTSYEASNGEWSFSGQFTGNPIADFLLGDGATFEQYSDEPRYYSHYPLVSPYVQDRWKANRRLTLTVGLRLEYEPMPNIQHAFGSVFDPPLYNSADAPIVNPSGTVTSTANYNPLNGLIINGVNGVPLNFTDAHEWYGAPSFGFAYDVFGDGKTSLRGGYQITNQNTFGLGTYGGQFTGNVPFVADTNLVTPSFPNPIGAGAAPVTIPSLVSQDVKTATAPMIQNYSLSLEHQFGNDWFASIRGAGTIGRNLWAEWNINQPLPDGPYNFNPVINTGTVSEYLYSPYLGYSGVSSMEYNDNAYWNALEVLLQHPVGHNLFLNVAYTWEHGLSDSTGNALAEGGPQNVYNPGADYGNETYNAAQVLAISAIWGLPWFHNAHGLKSLALRGWQYSDITTIQSGFSMSPGLSIAHPGLASRPNFVAGSTVVGPKTAQEWFNTSAFAAPAAGFFGSAGRGSITGPGVVNFDMALYKDFHVTEHDYFEFRAEAFNIFNHTNFNGVQTSFGAGNYGQATSARDPRIFEFALRFQF